MNANRRELANTIFIILSSIFIASLITCNLIANKFIHLDLGFHVFTLSAGVLPYPITFLVTDILSEIYGRKKTNRVVFSGFIASMVTLLFLWIGSQASALNQIEISGLEDSEKIKNAVDELVIFDNTTIIDDATITLDIVSYKELPDSSLIDSLLDFKYVERVLEAEIISQQSNNPEFSIVQSATSPVNDKVYDTVFQNAWKVIAASMVAYLCAQFLDVKLFHFWKRLTKGKHLWLRNNASTIGSQLVDTMLVVSILFIGVWPASQIGWAILDGWIFKMLCAFIDTPLFYIISGYLRNLFGLKLGEELSSD